MLCVKITESGLSLFLFSFLFLFVSIFRTLVSGVDMICHTVTSVTSDGAITTLIMELEKREWKVLETK